MPKLILTLGGVVLKTYALDKETVTVGRKSDNDIQLDDGSVSGRHARLKLAPDKYLDGHHSVTIEDLGSTNGTLVNDTPVSSQSLKNGDLIRIGQHQFTFQSDGGTLHERTAIYLPDDE